MLYIILHYDNRQAIFLAKNTSYHANNLAIHLIIYKMHALTLNLCE